jgi:hypothetical protein
VFSCVCFGECSLNSLLGTVAKFSETMLWVVGPLFLADLAALIIIVLRSGTVDQDEGCVVDEQGPLSQADRNAMGGDVTFAGTGQTKKRVFVSRSSFISDESLVDGSATKSQRFIVHGIKLAFLLFWLVVVFGMLSVLPSNPIAVLFVITIMSIILFQTATLVRKGRADALRKLKEETAPRSPAKPSEAQKVAKNSSPQ